MKSDKRARLLTKPGYSLPATGPGSPLSKTNRGIIFPYSPNITTQSSVDYNTYDTVHSNYQQHAYARTRAPNLQVAAQFINQTVDEAKYTAAAIHFLRVVTKMDFGADASRGTPPPVLNFSAYGAMNFQSVPVLVSSFTLAYPDDMDYIEFEVDGVGTTQLPVQMTIAIDLMPQYSPQRQNQFSVGALASGSLYKNNKGFI